MKSLRSGKPLTSLSGVPHEAEDPLPDKQMAPELDTPEGHSQNQQFATPELAELPPSRKWIAGAVPATIWANDRHLARLTIRAMLAWSGKGGAI